MSTQHIATPFKAQRNGKAGKTFSIVDDNGYTVATTSGQRSDGVIFLAEDRAEFIVRACNAHDGLVGFAQFVLKGIKGGHVTNASFIDHNLDGESVEVETLSSYAEKVLKQAGAA